MNLRIIIDTKEANKALRDISRNFSSMAINAETIAWFNEFSKQIEMACALAKEANA